MKQIKMCVFDMDGVLLDSESVYYLNAKKCSEIYHYNIPEEVLHATMGSSEKDAIRIFKEYLGQDFDYELFADREWELQLDYMKENPIQLKKGTIELLEYLKKNDIVSAIATSTSRDYATKCLKDAKIFDYFDSFVFGDDLKKSKPEPDIYLKAISAYPYKPEEILVLEDSHNGILSGTRAGLKVLYIPDIAYVPEETKQKAYKTLDSLLDVIDLLEK